MKLSARLEMVLSLVRPCSCVLDIGTDHAYTVIELIRRGICREAVGSDVRKGPLRKAQDHVQQAGLCGKIRLVRSDGCEAFSSGDADTLIISGMGGELTARLLREDLAREKPLLSGISQMVLEPQSEPAAVRRTVDSAGFLIEQEKIVEERGHVYMAFSCVPSDSIPEHGQAYYEFGEKLVQEKNHLYRKYLDKKRGTLERIRDSVVSSSKAAGLLTSSQKRRIDELEKEVNLLTEVLHAWD